MCVCVCFLLTKKKELTKNLIIGQIVANVQFNILF